MIPLRWSSSAQLSSRQEAQVGEKPLAWFKRLLLLNDTVLNSERHKIGQMHSRT